MSVSPFKTFLAGEVLTASDLNSSFTQITSNGEDLGWPATKAKDLDGNRLVLDADADTYLQVSTDDQIDFTAQGQILFQVDGTTSTAVNGVVIVASATGNDVVVKPRGSDTDIDIDIKPKGAGSVLIDGATVYSDPLTTRGDLVVRDASSTTRLAVGSANTVLGSDGTDPSWGEVATAMIADNAVTSAKLATAVNVLGTQTIAVPAGAMTSPDTSGAADGSVETSTNDVMLITKDFDASSDEFVQFRVPMPKGWNEGTFTAIIGWSHPSTATNFAVVWGVQAVAVGNDDAQDVAFGTAQTVTDTGGTTDDLYITSATSAVTAGGSPAESDELLIRVYRDADNGSDTLAVDARLHWVKILYTIDAATDA